MKTLMKTFLAAAVLAMVFFSCSKEDDAHQMRNSELSSQVPANNNFFPVYTIFDWSGHQDGLPGSCNLCWEGSGSEPRFGMFLVGITFCYDLSTGCYKDAKGYFEVKNGDKLYFKLSDGVITDYSEGDSDYYHKFFKELAEITGGTGIFKDASGNFFTNAMIRTEPRVWKADCFSQGYLSLTYETNPIRDNLLPHLYELQE